MFGSTPLTQQKDNGKQAVYAAKNYVELADSPMMFCLPDTTSFVVGGARIYVSVYSPNKKVASAQVASYLQPLGHALENFFGKLPTKHYHFIMYYASMDMMMPDAEGLSGYAHSNTTTPLCISCPKVMPKLPSSKWFRCLLTRVFAYSYPAQCPQRTNRGL